MTDLTPHPYLEIAPSLMGGGYRTLALRLEAGLEVESAHSVMRGIAAYDNGRQVNDNDQPNPKGHDRFLNSGVYFRANRLFSGQAFGGFGLRWSQLSTTNYTKTANRPQFGGGYDFISRSYSMRIMVNRVMAGNDWQNGSHGPEFSISMPSPRERHHWFYHQTLGIYRCHETVTEPSNIPLTRSQRAHRSITSYASFGIRYRF